MHYKQECTANMANLTNVINPINESTKVMSDESRTYVRYVTPFSPSFTGTKPNLKSRQALE